MRSALRRSVASSAPRTPSDVAHFGNMFVPPRALVRMCLVYFDGPSLMPSRYVWGLCFPRGDVRHQKTQLCVILLMCFCCSFPPRGRHSIMSAAISKSYFRLDSEKGFTVKPNTPVARAKCFSGPYLKPSTFTRIHQTPPQLPPKLPNPVHKSLRSPINCIHSQSPLLQIIE